MAPLPPLNHCACDLCQAGVDSPLRQQHHFINLLLSRLNEQQRRWYAATLALHYNSVIYTSKITGLSEKTIRRGLEELQAGLVGRPVGRVRK